MSVVTLSTFYAIKTAQCGDKVVGFFRDSEDRTYVGRLQLPPAKRPRPPASDLLAERHYLYYRLRRLSH